MAEITSRIDNRFCLGISEIESHLDRLLFRQYDITHLVNNVPLLIPPTETILKDT